MISTLHRVTPRRIRSHATRRLGRTLLAGLLVLAVAGLAACNSKTPAEQAAAALDQGLQAHVAGKLDEAVGHYNDCIKLESTNKLCLYNLGLVAQTQGRAVEAVTFYRASLATDPNYAPALFNLAILRTADGGQDEALTLYKKFVDLQPNDANGHLNYGLLLLTAGKTAEGEAELTKAVILNPDYASRIPSPAPGSPTPKPSTK